MFEPLVSRAQAIVADRRAAQIDRLAETAPPPGVTVTRTEDGVVLSGKRLRHRLVTDAALRSFGK